LTAFDVLGAVALELQLARIPARRRQTMAVFVEKCLDT
jgi:hypothetical protein